jgi:ATPase subunit of ABC transporter with duplicated ATPase domains
MLLKTGVIPATKKAFGLFRDPFADEAMQGAEDVFTTPDIRYVREALFQTARHGGFLAVIGESGAGKSTLRRDLIERVNRENAPVIVMSLHHRHGGQRREGQNPESGSYRRGHHQHHRAAGERQTQPGRPLPPVAPRPEGQQPGRLQPRSGD